jgi:hypothetical protein
MDNRPEKFMGTFEITFLLRAPISLAAGLSAMFIPLNVFKLWGTTQTPLSMIGFILLFGACVFVSERLLRLFAFVRLSPEDAATCLSHPWSPEAESFVTSQFQKKGFLRFIDVDRAMKMDQKEAEKARLASVQRFREKALRLRSFDQAMVNAQESTPS